eukprot:366212-Chlamydomonas_euryale.AAC.49
MPALSAARQTVSNSGLGDATKATPQHAVLSHPTPTPSRQLGREKCSQSSNSPIPPCGAWLAGHSTQSHQPFSKQQLLNHRPIRHPGHVSEAREPC